MKRYYMFFAALGVLTLGLVTWETITARDPLNDERIVSDLRKISQAIEQYEGQNGDLPDFLLELELSDDIKSRVSKYEYNKTSDSSYQLCATFKTKTSNPYDFTDYYSHPAPEYHDKGRQCFDYNLGASDYYPMTQRTTPSLTQTQAKARDTERTTDIKAIQGQLEAFYAQNGRYPSLENLNDDAWVMANLKGLDLEALRDPRGSDNNLVAAPASNVYAYAVTPASCDNDGQDCTSYTLTATLESGGTYEKAALN